MLDRWFSTIRLPLSWREFHRLPQNPAYKYEYLEGAAWLSPRPRYYHARLELVPRDEDLPREVDARETVIIRALEDRDWSKLSRLFAGSFSGVQPFASLGDRRRLEASRGCLKHTRGGGDGPLIGPACQVAVSMERGIPRGALLVTLIPPIDLDDLWSLEWDSPPPPDAVERRSGRPHLTWVFVSPWHSGYGVGTALLAHATKALSDLGYTELISTFILGNTASMLWHWCNGFQLLAYSGSKRKFRERMRATESQGERPGST
jgi:GNAT superfamily N-acetyltransferase